MIRILLILMLSSWVCFVQAIFIPIEIIQQFSEQGNSPESQKAALERRLEMAKMLKNQSVIADVSAQLAELMLNTGDLKAAERYLNQSTDAYLGVKNSIGVANTQLLFANLLLKKKEPRKALKLCNEALETFKDINNKKGMAMAYSILGQAQFALAMKTEARLNLEKAIRNFDDLPGGADGHKLYDKAKNVLEELNPLNVNDKYLKENEAMKDSLALVQRNLEELKRTERELKQAQLMQQRSIIENVLLTSNTISKMKRDSMQLALEKLDREAALANAMDSLSITERNLRRSKRELANQQRLAESERNRVEAVQKLRFYIALGAFGLLTLLIVFFVGRSQYKQRALNKLNKAYADLRLANKQLTETRDQLIESERFKQQFLANMSHEIRTPMNAVVGMTNLLLKTKTDEQQSKYLTAIKQSANNLLVIINDILDLSKIEAGKMELEQVNINLHNVVENVWNILHFKAEEKVLDFVLHLNTEVPHYVLGDETRLTQILINLAGNAIKFTEKGKVELRVELVGEQQNNKLIRFSVSDSGIGIPTEKLATIFESFSQASGDTARKFGGTGLGLTISRHLVSLHGGDLQVSSKLNEGSTFHFTVSYTLGKEVIPFNPVVAEQIQIDRHLHILLAEDNDFNQIVAVDTLEELFPGIKIDVAENGKIALDKLKANHYDLVLMDIQMPEMDGLEAARTIRESFPEPQNQMIICAMTASVTKQEVEDLFAAGMNDYVAKPFEPHELKAKIIQLLSSNKSV